MAEDKWADKRVGQDAVLESFRELTGLTQCDECGDFVALYIELDVLCLCLACRDKRKE